MWITLILSAFLFLPSTNSFASAAVARQKQMQQAQQQAVQQAMVQQAQQQMIQQYQQAVAQQVQQAELEAVAQQVVQQIQQQKALYVNAVRHRQIDYANAQQQAAIAAYAQQYQQAIAQEAIKQKLAFDAAQMAQIQQVAQAKAEAYAVQEMQARRQAQTYQAGQEVMNNRPYEPASSKDIQDVVDISDVWRKLDNDSRTWALLIDNQAKVATVSEYVDRFSKQGVKIQGPPIDYVHMIDDLAMQSPTMLTRPFKEILQIVAIMQYDFDNGMNKDALAQKMLGPDLYASNKKRLGR
jgi:hypothetical protein